MAIEVVHQVADEWLAELAEDAADGVVERSMVRVVRQWGTAGGPLAEVTVVAGYSVAGVAVRLSELVGSVPRFTRGADDDPDGVLARAWEQVSSLRLQVAELGLSVRGGRLQTVGQ